jgi:hypothetical protein
LWSKARKLKKRRCHARAVSYLRTTVVAWYTLLSSFAMNMLEIRSTIQHVRLKELEAMLRDGIDVNFCVA